VITVRRGAILEKPHYVERGLPGNPLRHFHDDRAMRETAELALGNRVVLLRESTDVVASVKRRSNNSLASVRLRFAMWQ
jgi:hypothetical protein